MKSPLVRVRTGAVMAALGTAASLLTGGCVGKPTAGEAAVRRDQDEIGALYRPGSVRSRLPDLDSRSPLQDYLQYAILNEPGIEAAYFDWVGSAGRITVARSLPDPRLTFQSDIADVVMSLVPGLMMDFPGPGKREWAANAATAGSEAKYFAFERAILRTAFRLKSAYYRLHFLEAEVSVNRGILGLIDEVEKLARAQYEVGKVTLQDVLRAQIEKERLTIVVENLEDSRNPLLLQFRAALGLHQDQPAPPVPTVFESTPLDLTAERLLESALARNPVLKAMEAEVRQADALIRLAHKARIPDASLGVMADANASPIVVMPRLSVTLPVWRDKIAAQIAEAEAMKQANEARLSAGQLELAVDFAERSFMYREATRNLQLLTGRLLPRARQSLDVAQSGYVAGMVDFLSLLDAERTLLGFQLSEVAARVQRELALAELSLLILGRPPADAPVLDPPATPPVNPIP